MQLLNTADALWAVGFPHAPPAASPDRAETVGSSLGPHAPTGYGVRLLLGARTKDPNCCWNQCGLASNAKMIRSEPGVLAPGREGQQ